jgi:hypothetical protein
MNQEPEKHKVQVEITENIFANAPTMLALCLTMMGLIKIYSALQRITTLIDDFLAICLITFLMATIFSYLALRSIPRSREKIYARLADSTFLAGLISATIVALFVVFSLAG